MEPRSLRVQIVLFNNRFDALVRTVQALIAAVAVARPNGSLSYVELAIGDCSPTPAITKTQEEGLLRNARDNGFDAAWYEFFDENLGSAGGSNRLAEGAKTDYLLVLNPDTYPSPWMIDRMMRAFIRGVGVVEARQLPIEHPKEYDLVTGVTSWSSGACSMYDRQVFQEVGGFDTDHFFLHCDDVDISWRVRLAGHQVIMEPTATTLHHKAISLDGGIPPPAFERYYGVLGKLMLATRYGAPEVIENTLAWIESKGDDVQKEAVEEFQRRAEDGRVPEELPNADRVAQFVGSEYARHRF